MHQSAQSFYSLFFSVFRIKRQFVVRVRESRFVYSSCSKCLSYALQTVSGRNRTVCVLRGWWGNKPAWPGQVLQQHPLLEKSKTVWLLFRGRAGGRRGTRPIPMCKHHTHKRQGSVVYITEDDLKLSELKRPSMLHCRTTMMTMKTILMTMTTTTMMVKMMYCIMEEKWHQQVVLCATAPPPASATCA